MSQMIVLYHYDKTKHYSIDSQNMPTSNSIVKVKLDPLFGVVTIDSVDEAF